MDYSSSLGLKPGKHYPGANVPHQAYDPRDKKFQPLFDIATVLKDEFIKLQGWTRSYVNVAVEFEYDPQLSKEKTSALSYNYERNIGAFFDENIYPDNIVYVEIPIKRKVVDEDGNPTGAFTKELVCVVFDVSLPNDPSAHLIIHDHRLFQVDYDASGAPLITQTLAAE